MWRIVDFEKILYEKRSFYLEKQIFQVKLVKHVKYIGHECSRTISNANE